MYFDEQIIKCGKCGHWHGFNEYECVEVENDRWIVEYLKCPDCEHLNDYDSKDITEADLDQINKLIDEAKR